MNIRKQKLICGEKKKNLLKGNKELKRYYS